MDDQNMQTPFDRLSEQQGNPFAHAPQQTGYEQQPRQTGYEQPQPQTGYEQPQPQTGYGQPQQPTGYGAPGYDPYLVHYEPRPRQTGPSSEPPKKKKSRIGLVIGIICAVLLVGAGITLWQLGFFHPKNGNYVWDDYKVFGLTAEIKLDGDKAAVTVNSTRTQETKTVECDVEFGYDTVTFVKDGKVLICDFDRKHGKIVSNDDSYVNGDIVFERE